MGDAMKLEQVARRARVSTATVSRVLNNTGLVRNTTRARVLKAIEELRYSPNLHARSLAGGKSKSIGVIVSNIENPFFLDIYKAVEEGAHDAGYESSSRANRPAPPAGPTPAAGTPAK
jgi:DNA-binding LacI/PurR family transcriptional regulator